MWLLYASLKSITIPLVHRSIQFRAMSSNGSFRSENLEIFIRLRRILLMANSAGAIWYARRKPSGGKGTLRLPGRCLSASVIATVDPAIQRCVYRVRSRRLPRKCRLRARAECCDHRTTVFDSHESPRWAPVPVLVVVSAPRKASRVPQRVEYRLQCPDIVFSGAVLVDDYLR